MDHLWWLWDLNKWCSLVPMWHCTCPFRKLKEVFLCSQQSLGWTYEKDLFVHFPTWKYQRDTYQIIKGIVIKARVLNYFPVLFQLSSLSPQGIKVIEFYYIPFTLVPYQTEYQWNTSAELPTWNCPSVRLIISCDVARHLVVTSRHLWFIG